MEDLKPCPFCGSYQTEVCRYSGDGHTSSGVCRKCGATGSRVTKSSFQSIEGMQEMAAELWNLRDPERLIEIQVSLADIKEAAERVAEANDGLISDASNEDEKITTVDEDPPAAEKPNKPEPPTVQDAAVMTLESQTPSSGGELDPDSGSLNQKAIRSLDTKPATPQQRLIQYFARPDVSIKVAEKAIGISHQTLTNIRQGKGASKPTVAKLTAALDKLEAADKEDPEPVNNKPRPISAPKSSGIKNPTQAAKFFSGAVNDWIEAKGLDPVTAAEILEVNQKVFSRIRLEKGGHLPHPNIIEKFGKEIPAIHRYQGLLLTNRHRLERENETVT